MSKTYAIKSGESLSVIAGREYGDVQLWPILAQANPSITNPNLVQPGQIITIPDIQDAVEVQAEVIESAPLPPGMLNWRGWLLILLAAGGVVYFVTKKKKGKATNSKKVVKRA